MTTEYPRGSEWRRWDLHVHTPGTYLNNQYTNNDWDLFIQRLNTSDVSVVGITDYLLIENYQKLCEYKSKIRKNLYILPNIEFRMTPETKDGKGINLHLLINPEDQNHINKIKDALARLCFESRGTSYYCTEKSLKELGNGSVANGVNLFKISFDTFKKWYKTENWIKDNSIIVASNSNKDGVSGLRDSGFLENRKDFYYFADAIFSANPKDIEYFLGKDVDKKETIISEYRSLKACIHGSDAHSYDKIFNPDQNRYCWIKADPTFNGLKQILYEPEDRVRILEKKPETRADYQIIDYIQINDEGFSSEPIYFSDKLTCIIGGKSTGKSILLQNLAEAIDKNEAEKNLVKSNRTKELANVKVFWKDGKSDENRKVIYIPQTYLNKLTDNKEEKTEIDDWISKVLLLNKTFLDAENELKTQIQNRKVEDSQKIIEFLADIDNSIEIKEKQKELGDKIGIENEIKKLTTEKETLAKSLGISEDNLKEYEDAIKNEKEISIKLDILNKDKQLVIGLDNLLEKRNIQLEISENSLNQIAKIQSNLLQKTNAEWMLERKAIIKNIDESIIYLNKQKKEYECIVEKLKPIVECRRLITDLQVRIKKETEKLEMFNKYQLKLNNLTEHINSTQDELLKSKDFYYKVHTNLIDIVNQLPKRDNDLSFYADVNFRSVSFGDKLRSLFDNRNSEFKNMIGSHEFDKEKYTNEFLRDLIEKVIYEKIVLINGITKEACLRELLGDWYNTLYKVQMENDTIDIMSPGKKALVLLKILISLAESDYPILIDQPEDDLDNRSIYKELAEFIKAKKKERQIIIVTHNANIVLGADAEEIIVANQEGNDCKNKSYRFEYRSGSIENIYPKLCDNGNIENGILNQQGIQQHICDILEGGEKAFELRKNKYRI
jgi:hypothetical protein